MAAIGPVAGCLCCVSAMCFFRSCKSVGAFHFLLSFALLSRCCTSIVLIYCFQLPPPKVSCDVLLLRVLLCCLKICDNLFYYLLFRVIVHTGVWLLQAKQVTILLANGVDAFFFFGVKFQGNLLVACNLHKQKCLS